MDTYIYKTNKWPLPYDLHMEVMTRVHMDISFLVVQMIKKSFECSIIYDKIPYLYLSKIVEIWMHIVSLSKKYNLNLMKHRKKLCRQLDIIYQTWERHYTGDKYFEKKYNELVLIMKKHFVDQSFFR